jgi:ComF family protein
MLKNFFKGILDFVIPSLCVSCEGLLDNSESYLCSRCSEKLAAFTGEHPWKKVHISSGLIDGSFSLYQFIKDTPIQHLLHSMKYEKMKSIGVKLGKEIGKNLNGGVRYDYAVPVPLHIAKARERTYNQSEYICRGIIKVTGSELIPRLILRNRFTKSQTKLDKSARQDNVRGAFEINPKYRNLIPGKNIILADDVITTGATILECARILRENGAGSVMICSAAYDALD